MPLIFDKFEIFMALNFSCRNDKNGNYCSGLVAGAYIYRFENRERILNEIKNSLDQDGEKSVYVSSGIFGNTAKTYLKNFELFKNYVNSISVK